MTFQYSKELFNVIVETEILCLPQISRQWLFILCSIRAQQKYLKGEKTGFVFTWP